MPARLLGADGVEVAGFEDVLVVSLVVGAQVDDDLACQVHVLADVGVQVAAEQSAGVIPA